MIVKRPFSLDEYLKDPSKMGIETRDGHEVKIVSTDTFNEAPVVGAFRLCAGSPVVRTFTNRGKDYIMIDKEEESIYDLFFVYEVEDKPIEPKPELDELEEVINKAFEYYDESNETGAVYYRFVKRTADAVRRIVAKEFAPSKEEMNSLRNAVVREKGVADTWALPILLERMEKFYVENKEKEDRLSDKDIAIKRYAEYYKSQFPYPTTQEAFTAGARWMEGHFEPITVIPTEFDYKPGGKRVLRTAGLNVDWPAELYIKKELDPAF